MTFHSIVRSWCRIYKPMRDSKKNRRFFLTDSTDGVVELAKGIKSFQSPCVVMESSIEGGGRIERPARNYPIYFFVKANKMSDGDAAAISKELAWVHCRNFLTWLKVKHDKEVEDNIDGDFARIALEDSFLDIQTIGPIENGWFAILVQIEREEPLNLCIDEDLYIEPTQENDDETDDSE